MGLGLSRVEITVGIIGMQKVRKGGGVEKSRLSVEGQEMIPACDQTLCLLKIGDEGAVMRRRAEGTRKRVGRQPGRLNISHLYAL
jgi:hypothetical protein